MAQPARVAPQDAAPDDSVPRAGWTEADRLAALHRYGVLDTPPEAAFDDLVRLAAQVCGTPVSSVSLIDRDRQWSKAAVGFERREIPLEHSVCARVMHQPGLTVIPDMTRDPRFAGLASVTAEGGMRFYAGAPLHSAEGLPLGMLCVVDTVPRGLTEAQGFGLRTLARQAEGQLELRRALLRAQAQEALFRDLADSAPFGIWVADAAGACTYLNRAWGEMTGRPTAAGLGFGWLETLHPEDAAAAGEIFAEAFAARLPFRLDCRLRRDDGSCRWVIDAGAPHHAPDGTFVGYVGTVLDITERRRAEDALRELSTGLERAVSARTAELHHERARLHAVLSCMPLGVMIAAAPGGEVTYANPAALRLTGRATPTAAGDAAAHGARHPDDTPYAAGDDLLARPRRDGAVAGPEDILYHSGDGGTTLLSVRTAPVRDEAGALTQVVALFEDVSAQRRTEEALREAQKMEAVGRLTGGIAHDFNNLLTGIVGSLELMRRRIDTGRAGEIGRYVQGAVQSAERAAALTHRLLAFARRQPLDARPTDVNALLLAGEDLLRRTVGAAVRLEVRPQPGLWRTLCDAAQLENALLNLAVNARDAMPEGGWLTVETANLPARSPDEGDRVLLRVSDGGTGMSPAVAARAFDPFFTTKPAGQNSGLGLSMIYGFARQSGGEVRIRSTPGQGTVVEIELPRHLGDPAEDARPDHARPHRDARDETVLVVEDQAVVRDVVLEVLRDLGYRVLEAADGASGLAVLRDSRVDLLVTDVGLPGGMNGRQLAGLARAERPGLKVLFITGYAEDALGPGALEAGMALLTKPFSVDVLAERLRGMIEA